jgi:PAS domain S-box-containing protein
MSRSKHPDSNKSHPLPIKELIRRSFRAGAFFPLVAVGLIVALGVPLRQTTQTTMQAENYAAVLDGIISDRTSRYIDRAEGLAVLIARSDDGVSTESRLEQLLVLDQSVEAVIVTNRQGDILASATRGINDAPQTANNDALTQISEQDSPYVGVPAFDSSIRNEVMLVAVPLSFATGGESGMLQVTIGTDWISAAIKRNNANLGVETFVTDASGVVVAHEDEWRVLASQTIYGSGNGLRTDVEGNWSIVGRVEVQGWNGDLVAVGAVPAGVVLPASAAGLLPIMFIVAAFVAARRSRQLLVKSVVGPVHELGTALGGYVPGTAFRMEETEIEEVNVAAEAFNTTAEQMDALIGSLEESNARFQALFDTGPVGMALHTIDGEYLNTNAVYNEMFGLSGVDICLSQVMEMVLPESLPTVRRAFASIARREVDTITFEGGFRGPSGKAVWAIVTSTILPQPGDAVDHVVAQVVDVTELKETQSKLEELLASKNQFLASVSHELRTPLTAVIGLAELLRDPDSDLSSEQRADLIDTIVESGFDVSNMVEDLLTAARHEAGQLTVVAVPVNMMAQTKQALEVLDPRANVSISGEASTAVADPGRVRQVLRNLLTNALKYGGDNVSVELGRSEDFAWATVIDDGPGVPPESAELIFLSYERAHGEESHPGSVGIGLSISRELARLMGGDLEYRRSAGRTHFDFTVPLLVDDTADVAQAEAAFSR